MKKIPTIVLLFINITAFAQKNVRNNYVDSLQKFQQEYVHHHHVIKGEDTVYLQFFPIDSNYRVVADFKKTEDSAFTMQLTEGKTAKYLKYGTVTFKLQNKTITLHLYQSETLMKLPGYKNNLLIPFIDLSNGIGSYGGGRYLDVAITDIIDNKVTLDFNKAYNPYCAYTTGYNCPIPTGENLIMLSINAGEKTYAKPMR
ncbi:MAG TPA: DUF1684 domain-containing protein [Ferruginibacter sp.]|nr:DUF1684 domain-containing protein [Ferruginibacter sp.]